MNHWGDMLKESINDIKNEKIKKENKPVKVTRPYNSRIRRAISKEIIKDIRESDLEIREISNKYSVSVSYAYKVRRDMNTRKDAI